jgi:hypothetical protein
VAIFAGGVFDDGPYFRATGAFLKASASGEKMRTLSIVTTKFEHYAERQFNDIVLNPFAFDNPSIWVTKFKPPILEG